MPIITVEGPPVKDIDRKRKFVQKLTDATFEMYGIDKEHIVVLIRENKPENVSAGGKLILDRRKK